jgi:DNA primase
MLDLDFVYSFIMENFPNVSVTRHGSHFNFRCPFCGDSEKSKKKKRFHLQFVNDESIFFNCFNCQSSGNFYDLYAHIHGISSEEAYKKLKRFNEDSIKQKLVTKSNITQKKIDFSKYENFNDFLERDCLSIDSNPTSYYHSKLIEYLKFFQGSRKITTKLFVCHSGTFEKRIIIPIIENDICIFFQGRRILETQYPKYLNPSIEKENIILNKENFNKEKFIIITEGILDADAVGTQGTTCLGASITDEFLRELFKYTNKGIVLALDNDKTGQEQIQKIFKQSEYNKKLLYFTLEKEKDLNEYKTDNPNTDVYKYVLDNALTYLEAYTLYTMDCRRRNC